LSEDVGGGCISDRLMPTVANPNMMVLNCASSIAATIFGVMANSPRKSPKKSGSSCQVYSPQPLLSYEPSRMSSRTASRVPAADASVDEVKMLKTLAGASDDDDLARPGSTVEALARRAQQQYNRTVSGRRRVIHRGPIQTLEVPGLVEDYYTQSLDWNSLNKIVASLSIGIYTWDATSLEIQTLTKEDKSPVRSIAWGKGLFNTILAEGMDSGGLRIRDTEENSIVSAYEELHCKRIGACACNPKGALIATGSKDTRIGFVDIRSRERAFYSGIGTIGHQQEVCGVKWDLDGILLASGGNDNFVMLWDSRALSRPLARFKEHQAAVKALAWSPHRRGRLVSGGGTADRKLRFWDAGTLSCLGQVDTSQICNIAWSENVDEIVTTHGFSQNHVVIWDTSSSTSSTIPVNKPATPVATLRGHKSRVLHLAVSPDGRTIATAAGDQTLRFWRVFPSSLSCSGGDDPKALTPKQRLRDYLPAYSSPITSDIIPECSLSVR